MYIGLELDVHESRGIYKIEGLHSVGDVHMSGHVCKFRDATGIVDFRDALELQRDVNSSAMLHKLQNN